MRESLQKSAIPLQRRVNAPSATMAQHENALAQSPRVVMQRKAMSDGFGGASASVGGGSTGGLPMTLTCGIAALSGMDLSDVKVHRASAKPAQLQALAFAQNNEIHLGLGQEKHLPHEAWHIVQQRQGRVKTTLQEKGVGINDEPGLENEATVMGERAMRIGGIGSVGDLPRARGGAAQSGSPVQRIEDEDEQSDEESEEEEVLGLDCKEDGIGEPSDDRGPMQLARSYNPKKPKVRKGTQKRKKLKPAAGTTGVRKRAVWRKKKTGAPRAKTTIISQSGSNVLSLGGKSYSGVTFGGLKNGCGTWMQAELDPTVIANITGRGSSPSVRPYWWQPMIDKVSKKTKHFISTKLVQGHLLNDNLGGPGNNMLNLTPITKSTNSEHNKKVETHVKARASEYLNNVKNGKPDNLDRITYHVTADYSKRPTWQMLGAPSDIKPYLSSFPYQINAEYTFWEKGANGKLVDKGGDRWEIMNEKR